MILSLKIIMKIILHTLEKEPKSLLTPQDLMKIM